MTQENLIAGQLRINNCTQRKIAILGGTGSGKTTTLKLLALNCPVPAFVFDPLNVIHISGFQRMAVTRPAIPRAKEAGEVFNKIKTKRGMIISFRNLLNSELVEFCNGFFSTWKPKDCMIFFDEIHEVVPEGGGEYSHEVERIWKHGRNSNIGFACTSQRPAMVDKNVLALTDYLILYRMTWEHDLNAVKGILAGMKKEDAYAVLSELQTKGFLQGYSIDFQPKINNALNKPFSEIK